MLSYTANCQHQYLIMAVSFERVHAACLHWLAVVTWPPHLLLLLLLVHASKGRRPTAASLTQRQAWHACCMIYAVDGEAPRVHMHSWLDQLMHAIYMAHPVNVFDMCLTCDSGRGGWHACSSCIAD